MYYFVSVCRFNSQLPLQTNVLLLDKANSVTGSHEVDDGGLFALAFIRLL